MQVPTRLLTRHVTSGNLLCHSVISPVKQTPQRYFEDFEDVIDQFGSVPQSCPTLCDPMDCGTPGFPIYHQLPEFAQTHVHWVSDAISSSVVPFSPCPQSFPASGSFPMCQLFSSCGQSIGASASESVLPMNIRDWSPLGWTGWISLLSKGLPRVFSNTTVQKHQFFSAQLSSQSSSHIHTWLLEKL